MILFESDILAAEAHGLVVAEELTVRRDSFLRTLQSELNRATRYNFLAALVLLRLQPGGPLSVAAELAELLARTVRSTDVLDSLGAGILALMAPHANHQTAARLRARIGADSLITAFLNKTGARIQAGYSLYPTDATTLASLFAVALSRLESFDAAQLPNV